MATPSLEYLNFCVPCYTDFKVNELPLLWEANFDFSKCFTWMPHDEKSFKGMNEILRKISEVKHLRSTENC